MLHTEKRWVVVAIVDDRLHFLGKYNWDDAIKNEPEVPTFRTRAQAMAARRRLQNCREETRVVAVDLCTVGKKGETDG